MVHKEITYYTCDRCGRRYTVQQDSFTVYHRGFNIVKDLCGPCSDALEDWFCKYDKIYQQRKTELGFTIDEEI